MNLIIIDSCTNTCPYCFAESEMSKNRTNTMSMETFEKVLQKIHATSSPVSVNVLGGEPLLHHNLGMMINALEREKKIETYTILSGGVVNKAAFDIFPIASKKISFLFNVNQRKDYKTETAYNLVHSNIGNLIDKGFKVSLGFNIYQVDFNIHEIIGCCNTYGITALRIAVAKPTYGVKNSNLLTPSQYKSLSVKVADLIEIAANNNIKVNIDCMLPKCFFNDKDLSRIIKMQPGLLDGVFGKCGVALDVSPQEDVFRCFATEEMKKMKLDNFENFDEIYDFFTDLFDNNAQRPNIFPECTVCKYSEDQTCKGDCFANWERLDVSQSFSSRLENIYTLIENKKLDLAFTALENFKSKTPAEYLLWAYYWTARENCEQARAYARKVIVSTNSEELVSEAKNILAFINSTPVF